MSKLLAQLGAVSAALLWAVPGVARAEGFEGGGFLGGDSASSSAEVATDFTFGARASYGLGRRFELEGESKFTLREATVWGWRGQSLFHLVAQDRARVFVLAGLGGETVFGAGTRPMIEIGAGAKVDVTDRLGLRLDLRRLAVHTGDGFAGAYEGHLGIYYRFGRRPPAAPPSAPLERFVEEPERLEVDEVPLSLEVAVVLFRKDRAELTPSAKYTLAHAAAELRRHRWARIEIGGHASTEGSEARNQQLSRRRAEAVVRYLTGLGVDWHQIEAQANGSRQPRYDEKSPAGRRMNRRVEITGTPAEETALVVQRDQQETRR